MSKNSFEDAKNEVAKRHKFIDWFYMMEHPKNRHNEDVYLQQAADIFAGWKCNNLVQIFNDIRELDPDVTELMRNSRITAFRNGQTNPLNDCCEMHTNHILLIENCIDRLAAKFPIPYPELI